MPRQEKIKIKGRRFSQGSLVGAGSGRSLEFGSGRKKFSGVERESEILGTWHKPMPFTWERSSSET